MVSFGFLLTPSQKGTPILRNNHITETRLPNVATCIQYSVAHCLTAQAKPRLLQQDQAVDSLCSWSMEHITASISTRGILFSKGHAKAERGIATKRHRCQHPSQNDVAVVIRLIWANMRDLREGLAYLGSPYSQVRSL